MISGGNSIELGGLVGHNAGSEEYISNCFWDIQKSGLSESAGGTGLTTAQMQDPNTFIDAGWDFINAPDGPSDIWAQPIGGGFPILWWQLPESQLPLLPKFSGGTGQPNDPYLLSTANDLNHIGYNPRLMAAHFKLINDIDLKDVEFFVVGNEVFPFDGVFDGNGYTISNFTYILTNTDYAGFFTYIDGTNAEVKNLGLIDPNVDSETGWKVGALIGQLEHGTITDCYVQGGSVSGHNYLSGLEGNINAGRSIVGGLVGGSNGTITDCRATCSVFGTSHAGGLVGVSSGTITKCTSTGRISGNKYVGGLLGENNGEITTCYSTGNVSANGSHVGGLVGSNTGIIINSYARASVSGNSIVGGMVGSNGYIQTSDVYFEIPGEIFNSYSTGSVSGTSFVGGLVGLHEVGSVTSSFWDMQTSSQTTSDGGMGKTTAEMQTSSTFLDAGWDFVDESVNGTEDIWWIDEGKDYPRLTWELLTNDHR